MPHLRLEHSDNLVGTLNPRELFTQLHAVLITLETFNPVDLKSRCLPVHDAQVGDGSGNSSFAHLEVSLLAGRDVSVRQRVAHLCLRAMEAHFAAALTSQDCQLSVEVREMERASYAKHRSGDVPTG